MLTIGCISHFFLFLFFIRKKLATCKKERLFPIVSYSIGNEFSSRREIGKACHVLRNAYVIDAAWQRSRVHTLTRRILSRFYFNQWYRYLSSCFIRLKFDSVLQRIYTWRLNAQQLYCNSQHYILFALMKLPIWSFVLNQMDGYRRLDSFLRIALFRIAAAVKHCIQLLLCYTLLLRGLLLSVYLLVARYQNSIY